MEPYRQAGARYQPHAQADLEHEEAEATQQIGLQSLKTRVMDRGAKELKQPGWFSVETVKSGMRKLKAKLTVYKMENWRDIALFIGTTAVVYQYGDKIAGSVEDMVPSEEHMAKMMREMQA